MAEPFQSRTALAALGLAARAAADAEIEDAGVVLAERPLRAMVALRGDPGDKKFVSAVEHALDAAPPTAPNTVTGPAVLGDGPRILWLGPDEWLVVTAASEGPDMPAALRGALGDIHSAVVDVSDGRTVIALFGPQARDVLSKGCGIDLHASAFAAGRCAQTHLAKAHVLIHQTGDAPAYEIYVHRSFAPYLWAWLEDAASEYGLKVEAA